MTIKASGNMMEIPIEKAEKTIMLQFVEVLQTNPDHAYDFVSSNYWKMSKEELANIVKELLYGIHTAKRNGVILESDEEEILDSVAEELYQQYEEEENYNQQ